MSEKSTVFQVCASPARVGVLLGQPSTLQEFLHCPVASAKPSAESGVAVKSFLLMQGSS